MIKICKFFFQLRNIWCHVWKNSEVYTYLNLFFCDSTKYCNSAALISRLSLTFVSPDSLKIIGKSSIFKISYPGYLIIIRLYRFKKYKNPNKKLFYQRFFINTRNAKDLGSFRWYFIEEVVSSCTMFLKSVDYVHDGLDVFRCFIGFLDVYSMFLDVWGTRCLRYSKMCKRVNKMSVDMFFQNMN